MQHTDVAEILPGVDNGIGYVYKWYAAFTEFVRGKLVSTVNVALQDMHHLKVLHQFYTIYM